MLRFGFEDIELETQRWLASVIPGPSQAMLHVGLCCANPTYGAPVGAEAAKFFDPVFVHSRLNRSRMSVFARLEGCADGGLRGAPGRRPRIHRGVNIRAPRAEVRRKSVQGGSPLIIRAQPCNP